MADVAFSVHEFSALGLSSVSDNCRAHLHAANWEQECVRSMLANDEQSLRQHAKLLPYGEIEGFAPDMPVLAPILHFTNSPYTGNTELRVRGMKNLLDAWSASASSA